MKRKRLDHDLWGFQGFPYYQMRIDTEEFHGLAALIDLCDGEYYYWDMPKAGKVPVCGKGMLWLELIPDHRKHITTVKFKPTQFKEEHAVSVWYVDVIDEIGYDEDGTLVFLDKYLDVIFSPQGDIKIDDRDELEDAYATGELTKEQFESALAEGDSIIASLCSDINATEITSQKLLAHALQLIREKKTLLSRNENGRKQDASI